MDTRIKITWPTVAVLALLIVGAVGAYALGGSELAGVLAGLAGGIAIPTRGRVTP